MNSPFQAWSLSSQRVKELINNLQSGKCPGLHQHSCTYKAVDQFFRSFRSLFKIYLILHIFHFILAIIKNKHDKKRLKTLLNFVKGFSNSMLFSCGFTLITYGVVCIGIRINNNSRACNLIGTMIGGIALLAQSKARQRETALFCVSKSIQTAYKLLQRRKYHIHLPIGQLLLMAFSCSIISFLFYNRYNIDDKYRQVIRYMLEEQ